MVGKGQVKIPLPDGFRTNALKVYRCNDDGTLLDMNGYVENGYIIFETDHFSYYLVLDETADHIDSNKDGICDICSTNLTANCTCACHSNAFIKLIYKIIAFILSLFGSSFDCACGMSHR